jgi:hypothetical protein
MRGPLVKSTKNKEKLPATTPKVWGKGPVRIYDSVSGASLYRGYVRQRTLSDGIKHLDKPTDSRHYSDMSAVDTVPISAKDAAQKVLDTVWKDRPFPVDPVWLAAQFGIKVVETDLPEEVSGAIIKNKDKDPVIALSNSDHKNRKRFSCAHELGHYAFRMDAGEEEYGYVDFRGKAAGMGTAPESHKQGLTKGP